MNKSIFDIETDGLLEEVTTVWCLVLRNIDDVNNVAVYTDYVVYKNRAGDLEAGLAKLTLQRVIAGHNVIGYDLAVLKKLYNWSPDPATKVWDTWLMSLVLQYKRNHKHGLAGWGEALGEPKHEFNEWDKCSVEMIDYCIQDTLVNWKVYHKLVNNVKSLIQRNPLAKRGLEVEMEFALIEQEIQLGGWNFDHTAGIKLKSAIETEMAGIEQCIVPKIGLQCIRKDNEPKSPRYKKNGSLYSSSVNDLGSEDVASPGAAYSRITFEEPSLGSLEVVKKYLYSIGWEPDEWNFEKIGGKFVKKSPKLTDSSLEKLEDGDKLIRYFAIRNRLGILNGWLEQVEKKGRLHGRMWTIGTPTFRCRHETIANLPSVDSILGKEMRGLFLPDNKYVLVGADSSGNQMRGFCHYLGNDDFTKEVVEGDIHQRNASILEVSRKAAKPFLYAFLFGASAGKLYLTLHGVRDAKKGQVLMDKFSEATPGLKEMKARLEAEYQESVLRFGTEYGYISGIDGRRIFVDSPHKLLVSLLQSLEGLTCKAAAVYTKRKLLAENIKHNFLLHYHDELCVQCLPEDAERVAEICVEAFTESPKWFNVNIMTGAAHIGNNYAEVH